MRASRQYADEPFDTVVGDFFHELNPHLRNVQACAVTGADAIYEYLVRRGPCAIERISQSTGHLPDAAVRIMAKEPGRFRCERGQWSVNSGYNAPLAPPEPVRLMDRMAAYLATNGPSTAQQIADSTATGINTVFEALNRSRIIADVGTVGKGRNRRKLWMVR